LFNPLSEVVLEETTGNGVSDSPPISVYDLIVKMETQGNLDLKVSGHTLSRPVAVQRGTESDRCGLGTIRFQQTPTTD